MSGPGQQSGTAGGGLVPATANPQVSHGATLQRHGLWESPGACLQIKSADHPCGLRNNFSRPPRVFDACHFHSLTCNCDLCTVNLSLLLFLPLRAQVPGISWQGL